MIWTEFAKFYEENSQIDEARFVFERAVKANYKTVDELAAVWCEWTEMELRNE
jgi:pre-mRNA-splicing factor SYF1